MAHVVWERKMYARKHSMFCQSWKKSAKVLGFFIVALFVPFSLSAEEELASLMPLPKTCGSHGSTAHHVTHSVINLLLWKDL